MCLPTSAIIITIRAAQSSLSCVLKRRSTLTHSSGVPTVQHPLPLMHSHTHPPTDMHT